MGGGGKIPYPKHVWSPTGGWYSQPGNWKTNTAIMAAVITGITVLVWNQSARLEQRTAFPEPHRPFPSRWYAHGESAQERITPAGRVVNLPAVWLMKGREPRGHASSRQVTAHSARSDHHGSSAVTSNASVEPLSAALLHEGPVDLVRHVLCTLSEEAAQFMVIWADDVDVSHGLIAGRKLVGSAEVRHRFPDDKWKVMVVGSIDAGAFGENAFYKLEGPCGGTDQMKRPGAQERRRERLVIET
ncbi:MAG: hypothetical protein M1838_002625 [Thelocarpon superellum]|nr:MAG: hypothetical protein M1838_002625 [Thelocarpon superellum]